MICNLISMSDLFLYLLLLHLIFIFIEKNRFKIFQNGEVYRLGIFYHPKVSSNETFETIKKAWQNTGVKYTHTSSGLAHYNSHCVAIRSVRTFWLRKLTAITDLHSGHFILMIPTVYSGFASNNLLFLQHEQATCISCIYLRLPQEASQREKSNWPLYSSLSFALLSVT